MKLNLQIGDPKENLEEIGSLGSIPHSSTGNSKNVKGGSGFAEVNKIKRLKLLSGQPTTLKKAEQVIPSNIFEKKSSNNRGTFEFNQAHEESENELMKQLEREFNSSSPQDIDVNSGDYFQRNEIFSFKNILSADELDMNELDSMQQFANDIEDINNQNHNDLDEIFHIDN